MSDSDDFYFLVCKKRFSYEVRSDFCINGGRTDGEATDILEVYFSNVSIFTRDDGFSLAFQRRFKNFQEEGIIFPRQDFTDFILS